MDKLFKVMLMAQLKHYCLFHQCVNNGCPIIPGGNELIASSVLLVVGKVMSCANLHMYTFIEILYMLTNDISIYIHRCISGTSEVFFFY